MSEMADYLLDNYGTCDREADCYHGRDARGEFNGCLKIGWIGRGCTHWRPLGVTSLREAAQELLDAVDKSGEPTDWFPSISKLKRTLSATGSDE